MEWDVRSKARMGRHHVLPPEMPGPPSRQQPRHSLQQGTLKAGLFPSSLFSSFPPLPPSHSPTSINVSMTTAAIVCAVFATITVAPMNRPKVCATRVTSITDSQLKKK